MKMNSLTVLAVLVLTGLSLAQTVELVSPADNATLGSTDVTFVFKASDDADPVLDCALGLDGLTNVSGIAAANGTDTEVNVSGIAEGAHTWTVSCMNDANSTNVTEVRAFSVELPSPPVVGLDSPADNATLNSTAVNFTFTATEPDNESLACTLSLDGAANSTSPAVSGTPVTIPVSGLSAGAHTWSVSCTDVENETGMSPVRSFTIDLDADDDGVDDGADACPSSVADTMKLKPNHYGQLNLSTSAFEVGPKMLQSTVYNMTSTKGCTCAQIVQKLGVGKGLLKHGCSPGLMQVWASLSHVPDQKAGVGKKK